MKGGGGGGGGRDEEGGKTRMNGVRMLHHESLSSHSTLLAIILHYNVN